MSVESRRGKAFVRSSLAVLLLVVAAASAPGEDKKAPAVDGKTLSEWTKLLQSDDVVDRQGAVMALGKLGPAAVPGLTVALQDKEVVNCRLWAASALGKLGAKAKAAVPFLAAALKDDSGLVRIEAARALWKIDKAKAAVPALAEALKARDATTRYYAAKALADVGAGAKAAVPALVKALKDTGAAEFHPPGGGVELRPVREEAARALRRVDPATAKKHGVE
jgi:HEAT repeat protein